MLFRELTDCVHPAALQRQRNDINVYCLHAHTTHILSVLVVLRSKKADSGLFALSKGVCCTLKSFCALLTCNMSLAAVGSALASSGVTKRSILSCAEIRRLTLCELNVLVVFTP